jgi:DNA-directed RNA polymerase subunit RPC12/RpoP
MTDHETTHAVAICAVCGARNELTALKLPSGEIVACSHCGTVLGTWGALAHLPKRRATKSSHGPGAAEAAD